LEEWGGERGGIGWDEMEGDCLVVYSTLSKKRFGI